MSTRDYGDYSRNSDSRSVRKSDTVSLRSIRYLFGDRVVTHPTGNIRSDFLDPETGRSKHDRRFKDDYNSWNDETSGFKGFWRSIKGYDGLGGWIPLAMFATALGGYHFLPGLFGSSQSANSLSANDAILKSLYGDAYNSSSQSHRFGWLGNLFSGLFGGKGNYSGTSSNFLSSLFGMGTDYASSLLNMKNMKELIDYQNQYNTPANQMQRFADAGLNPNLVYGLGSNGNQPASGSIAPVDFATHQRENRLANFQMQLQSKQVMADIAQKQAMVNLYDKQAQGIDLENQYNAQTLNDRVMQVSQTVSKLANELELQTKEINSWDEYRQAQLDLMEAQMYASYLSGHSIFGKVTVELNEIANRLKVRYPKFFAEWEKFKNGMVDAGSYYINN